ncbi:MAG TPA: hypothetical protein VG737_08780 [Cyclobacteriaceae bacterium]|nr:hypothetical protein [Cyclobacteriaceae bacterium]
MRPRLPLAKLPDKLDSVLFLLREELKSRKLFHALHIAGLDDCFFQPHLDGLITRTIGLYDGKDETFNAYDEIMDRRSKKIEEHNESVMKQAMKAYIEIIALKKEIEASEKTL